MLEVAIKARMGDFPVEAEFSVEAGITALIGPSGAGKSSLLRLIAGLDRPERGKISFEKTVWADATTQRFVPPHKRRIGMVFQTGLLLSHLSVMDNIKLGARGERVRGDQLVRTGCDTLLDKPVATLSGGEQQKVMLARALAGKPQLLLLDEPLSALDPESRDDMLELLGAALPLLDIPAIYVTHAFEEASRLASRFVRMGEGKVEAVGSAVQVLANTGLKHQEKAVSSVIAGVVSSLDGGGIASVAVGRQSVEMSSVGLTPGEKVHLRLWARDLILAESKPYGISARNALVGRIAQMSALPNGQISVRVMVEGAQIDVLVMSRTAREMGLAEEKPIFIVFKSASLEPAST
ncbi:MAG TPA: ATP-binding cassette domain-containing protein [Devosia sp.]|nr:ATP-binding cassette domain-containing protein [Devosia sp.]